MQSKGRYPAPVRGLQRGGLIVSGSVSAWAQRPAGPTPPMETRTATVLSLAPHTGAGLHPPERWRQSRRDQKRLERGRENAQRPQRLGEEDGRGQENEIPQDGWGRDGWELVSGPALSRGRGRPLGTGAQLGGLTAKHASDKKRDRTRPRAPGANGTRAEPHTPTWTALRRPHSQAGASQH